MNYTLHQIGTVHSPFKEKFGIPRQPGLIDGSVGSIELHAPWDRQEALQGLEGFSHLWVVFIFHQAIKPVEQWRPTVRPPRLGKQRRQGVFATRSPYRPNPIGLSVVEYHGWEKRNGKLHLSISGLDLLDATPVIDIKPYLPYADSLADAKGGFAHEAPQSESMTVEFTQSAAQQLQQALHKYPQLKQLIESTLIHNPRPAYFGNIEQRSRFGMQLYEFNVQWEIIDSTIRVLNL